MQISASVFAPGLSVCTTSMGAIRSDFACSPVMLMPDVMKMPARTMTATVAMANASPLFMMLEMNAEYNKYSSTGGRDSED